MTKGNFIPGTSTQADFFYWMNERHNIWLKRLAGRPKPWTNDIVMLDYKFTNVYRQLDKTTVALHKNILNHHNDDPKLILFNVVWFRMFGWIELTELGFVKYVSTVAEFLNHRYRKGQKIFTGAYMSAGNGLRNGEPKHTTYINTLIDVYPLLNDAVDYIQEHNTLQSAYQWLLTVPYIGPFYAYEMACDLRFTELLSSAKDVCEWGNIGPGARRGMMRLGMDPSIESMKHLLIKAHSGSFKHITNPGHEWPFELREIEHSLCEFDKYQRVLLGQGNVRSKYEGRNC